MWVARHQRLPSQREVFRTKAVTPGQKPTIMGASNSTQEIQGWHSCTWRWDRKASKGAKEGTAGAMEETQRGPRQWWSHAALGRVRSGKAPLGLACGALSDLDRSVGGGGASGEPAKGCQCQSTRVALSGAVEGAEDQRPSALFLF